TQLTRFHRLAQLTSPISYMSSIPDDKFYSPISEDADNRFARTYPYWEPRFADTYRNPNQLGRHFKNQDRPNGLWALMSYGPDGDFEAASGGDLAPYDASNGLNSNGDIMRFGL